MTRHPASFLLPVLAVGALLAFPPPAESQIRASERAFVSQTVDGTVIAVDYARPKARGRDHLFGEVVHWGEVWTPGANDATVLELSRDVTLEGHPVPAGRWSMWLITAEEGPWELVLDPRDTLFHTNRPGTEDDQIRLDVRVESGEPLDVLTFWFPAYRADGTTLALGWGDTRLSLDFEVESSLPLTVEAVVAEPYTGEWKVEWEPPPGGQEMPGPPGPRSFDVRYEPGDSLLLARTHLPWMEDPTDMVLLTRAEGIFVPGFMMNGEIMETLEATVEFDLDEAGRPVAFAVRGPEDNVWARGLRGEGGP